MNADHLNSSTRMGSPHAPGSGDAIVGWSDGPGEPIPHVRLSMPPVEGKANAALVRLLSSALGLSRRDVAVVRGPTSRHTLIEVWGLGASAVGERLAKSR